MLLSHLNVRLFRKPFWNTITRNASTKIATQKLVYTKRGNPRNLVELVDENINPDDITADEVLVKMLATPINPSDINQIEGTYMRLPPIPATPGNEFVGEVLHTGSSVSHLLPGDHVIAAVPGLGTWRSHFFAPQSHLQKVPKSLPINFAATMLVNPCTAYRMLQDFVQLKVGDCLIQNAANSAVGQMVIQMAKYKGVNTINIIRDREDFSATQQMLEGLGASVVLSDKQVRSPQEKASVIGRYGRAKLAFNAVGGKSVNDLSAYLECKGTVVTYGAMSREPNVIPAGKLIFMDHRYVGYWNSRWLDEKGDSFEYKKMIEDITNLVMDGRIVGPVIEQFRLEAYKEAIERYFTPFTNRKQMFIP